MSTNSSDYQEVRAVPSVSRDRWLEHARKKLEKGYALIVSDERRNANFYMAGKGYETCPHKTAIQLIKQGVVKKAGKHHLGSMYFLAEDAVVDSPRPTTRRPADDEEDDEVTEASEYDDIVDELEDTESADEGDEDEDEGEYDEEEDDL
ncbi:MAG: hypothetical protein R3282_04325 [Rhodothermales bacterium]|nr:hypothetical protein [Rhodothermales bacterium]